jgi:Xaa-Pro aminopeptidase
VNYSRKRYILLDALDRLGCDYEGIIREWKEITRELDVEIVVSENEALFDSRKFKEKGEIEKLTKAGYLACTLM